MMDEPIDLDAKRKEVFSGPCYYYCSECGNDNWVMWDDGIAECAACKCIAPNVEVREVS